MPNLSATSIFKNTRPRPPDRVDFDRVDRRTQQALLALSRIVGLLQQKAPSTVAAVHDQWDYIWPWVKVLSQSVLEEAKTPKTPPGEEIVANVLESLPIILTYPIQTHQSVDFRVELYPLLTSTSEVLKFSTLLWLHASRNDYPERTITALCDCVGKLLLSHYWYRAKEGPPSAFSDALSATKYDIGPELVKGIIEHVSGPNVSCDHLIAPIVILLTTYFVRDQTHMKSCLDRGAVRWLGFTVCRLTSYEKMKQWWEFGFNDISYCVVQAMNILCELGRHNPLSILEALDEGVVPAILQSRKLVIEDNERRPDTWGDSGRPSAVFDDFLEMIRRRLLFRPIMVRIARAIRKVQKMKLSDDDLDVCGNIKVTWRKLEAEVERRLRVYNFEDGFSDSYGRKICGYEQCPLHADPTIPRRGFQRCSGCYDTLYCSSICQKKDWKDKHRTECKEIQARVARTGPFYLFTVDRAYLQNHKTYDFYHADLSVIKDLPTDQSQYSIRMDYTKGDLELGIVTREECGPLLGGSFYPQLGIRFDMELPPGSKPPAAMACFPWLGDTVKVWVVQ